MKKIKVAPKVLEYGVYKNTDFLDQEDIMSYVIMPRYAKNLACKKSFDKTTVLDVGLALLSQLE